MEDNVHWKSLAFMHDNKLTEDFAISVKPGGYHRFGYETDGKTDSPVC